MALEKKLNSHLFRNISSYEKRENCIRRELRRRRSPEIQQYIEQYEEMEKQSIGTKRGQSMQLSIRATREMQRWKRERHTALIR
jgi:hypothetical protein